ncbi:unnamed protein product [Coregonus sp. 'balchen']|nr:unnamed protein product [Coregonus sp. 'balchen']
MDPLEQAKLDLTSAYSLNSLFWSNVLGHTRNKPQTIKQELERIRTDMNRVKEITDRRKVASLDKAAASRFLRNALWEPEEGGGGGSKGTPGRAHQHTPGRGKYTPGRGKYTPGRGKYTPGRGKHTPGRGKYKRFDGHQSKGPKLS